jgi:hypothetical protein
VPLARQRWVWAPVWPMPLRDHHLRLRPAMARQRPEACTRPPGQMTPVDPAAQVDPARVGRVAPAVLENTARADLVDLLVDPAAQVVPDPAALVARADLDTQAALVPMVRVVRADLVVPVVPVARAVPVGQAVLGTGTLSVATSTEPRGEKDPLPGATASHPGRTGEGRSRRPADGGTMARSTTGATKKHPCGTPDSTSGASTSSESGSRCK